MTKRQPRAPKRRNPKPGDQISEYVLDAVGPPLRPQAMSEILAKGTPQEVREFLGGQGALIRAGVSLPAVVAEWLGVALEAIGGGEDANLALRVRSGRRGRPPIGDDERAEIDAQVEKLVRQDLSERDAAGIVERYQIALRHNDDPDALWGETHADHEMAADRLLKVRRRGSQGTK